MGDLNIALLEKKALSFEDLIELLGKENSSHTRFMTYSQMLKFKTLSQIFKDGYDAAIILLENHETRSKTAYGHFVLLLDHDGSVEHFDSYGLSADEELSLEKEKRLSKFFNNEDRALVQNTFEFQSYGGHINTCGRWCVVRLLLKRLTLEQFIKFIKTFPHIPKDQLVTILTVLLPYKK